jgi:hypothetical protein
MTAPCSLGIDIGVQSAIAILDQSGALLEIHDMPVLAIIRAALTKDHDGSPATLLGAALDKLAEAA